ncbi:hypothetical protein [Providencia hangzhouensis]|uniref:hypothetical protein n=1 Tax=Providencia hangzhouensis TaxID=3031799 RepID=UPI003F4B0B01
MKNKINDSTDKLFGIKIFILGWLMVVLAVGLSSLLGINIFSQVLIGIGSFVILINLHRMFSWFVGLLLIGYIVDEHREERLSILSDHLDLAKSYLGMKK